MPPVRLSVPFPELPIRRAVFVQLPLARFTTPVLPASRAMEPRALVTDPPLIVSVPLSPLLAPMTMLAAAWETEPLLVAIASVPPEMVVPPV